MAVKRMFIKAPAKVNWHLQVGPRREDGFHTLLSVFQKIDLCDLMEISVEDAGDFCIEVTGLEKIVQKGCSTIEKAAALWYEQNKKNVHVNVKVTKVIPCRSGLGGGSSDAASFLMALEEMTEFPTSPFALLDIARKTGSDVPFFLCGSDAAVVGGTGELIYPIEARRDLSGFLVFSTREKTGTKEAYEMLDRRPQIPSFMPIEDMIAMYYGDVSKWAFTNDFSVLYEKKEGAVLTGSGNCFISFEKPQGYAVPFTTAGVNIYNV